MGFRNPVRHYEVVASLRRQYKKLTANCRTCHFNNISIRRASLVKGKTRYDLGGTAYTAPTPWASSSQQGTSDTGRTSRLLNQSEEGILASRLKTLLPCPGYLS